MKTRTADIGPKIDYPQEGEVILSREYAFRIAAPAAVAALDVSIDKGPWLACRKEVGFWWYDWSGYVNGKHELIARTLGANGRWRMSAPRRMLVATTA